MLVDSLSPAGDTLTKFRFFFDVWQRLGRNHAGVVRATCFSSLASPSDVVAIGQSLSFGGVRRDVLIRGDGRVEYRWSTEGPVYHEAYGTLDPIVLEALLMFAEDLDVDCLPDWNAEPTPSWDAAGALTVVARKDVQNVFYIDYLRAPEGIPGRLMAIEPFLDMALRRTEWQVKPDGPMDFSFHPWREWQPE